MPSLRQICVTGRGAVCGFGQGLDALRGGIINGTTAIRPVDRYDTTTLRTRLASLVPGTGSTWMGPGEGPESFQLATDYARSAGLEAMAEAGISPTPRMGLVLGCNLEGEPEPVSVLLAHIGAALNINGPRVLVSTACASSTAAVATAVGWLRAGQVDCVVVGGADVVTPRLHGGFDVLGASGDTACRPFDQQIGLTVGEGAAFLVLEWEDEARARGAQVFARVGGVGGAGDAHHPTQPHPSGDGVRRAIQAALRDAGVEASAVDYVNAHATGTAANDAAEVRGVAAALGDVPTSGAKHLFGHAQGAAGMLETVATLLCLERGCVPPTWGLETPRVGAPEDPVITGTPRKMEPRNWIKTTSGFGGTNATVLYGTRTRPEAKHPVYVGGFSALGPSELTSDGLRAWLTGSSTPPDHNDRQWARWDRRSNPHVITPTGVGLIGACRRLNVGSPASREQTGLWVAADACSERIREQISRGLKEGGPMSVPAAAFSRSVLTTAAGEAATALGLRGPLFTMVAGRAGGMVAAVDAAWSLAQRPSDGDAYVAAASEVSPWTGAVALHLTRTPTDVVLEDWGIAACGSEGPTPRDEELVLELGPPSLPGNGSPCDALLVLALALCKLRATDCTRVLIRCDSPDLLFVWMRLSSTPKPGASVA